MKKIEVFIIDDHSLFRDTLSFMMNKDGRFKVIGSTHDADIAFASAKEKEPDIILMDINMAPVDGFKLTERLLAYSAKFKIIAISMHALLTYARSMLQTGAWGYMTKNSAIEELFACIIEVYNGKKYVCSEIRDVLVNLELHSLSSGMNALSNRELGVARLLKEGLSSKDIASRLEIASKTVEAHRYNILKKLKLKNTAALVNFTNLHGL
jgi:DNA-binding NarL/FixJ family response regulator